VIAIGISDRTLERIFGVALLHRSEDAAPPLNSLAIIRLSTSGLRMGRLLKRRRRPAGSTAGRPMLPGCCRLASGQPPRVCTGYRRCARRQSVRAIADARAGSLYGLSPMRAPAASAKIRIGQTSSHSTVWERMICAIDLTPASVQVLPLSEVVHVQRS